MAARFRLTAPVVPERQSQVDVAKMLDLVLLPEVCWTAIDHGHSMNLKIGRNGKPIGLMEAVQRKRRGIKPGITDYLFWHQSYAYAIEYKVGDGTLSDDEKAFLRRLIASGVTCKVCWGQTQIMDTVWSWQLCRPSVRWQPAFQRSAA